MPSTTEQLHADIDLGRTGDKVQAGDPAAVPLGADEEAAGTPVAGDAVDAARQSERGRIPHAPQRKSGLGATWVLVAFIIAFAIVISSWMLSLPAATMPTS
jgi:hypothetical protein